MIPTQKVPPLHWMHKSTSLSLQQQQQQQKADLNTLKLKSFSTRFFIRFCGTFGGFGCLVGCIWVFAGILKGNTTWWSDKAFTHSWSYHLSLLETNSQDLNSFMSVKNQNSNTRIYVPSNYFAGTLKFSQVLVCEVGEVSVFLFDRHLYYCLVHYSAIKIHNTFWKPFTIQM